MPITAANDVLQYSFVDRDMYMRFIGGGVGHGPNAGGASRTLDLNSDVEIEQFVDPIEARKPAYAAPEEGQVDDVMGDESDWESDSDEDGGQEDVDMGISSDESNNTLVQRSILSGGIRINHKRDNQS